MRATSNQCYFPFHTFLAKGTHAHAIGNYLQVLFFLFARSATALQKQLSHYFHETQVFIRRNANENIFYAVRSEYYNF